MGRWIIGSSNGLSKPCGLCGAKPLPEPMIVSCQLGVLEQTEMRFRVEQLLFTTLKQSSGGTSCGFTNIKSNWNMPRSDWKCSPAHELEYWLNQSKWTFFHVNNRRGRYVYPRVGEWVTQREISLAKWRPLNLLRPRGVHKIGHIPWLPIFSTSACLI